MAISTIGQNGLNAPLSLTLPVVATTMGVGGATPSGSGSGITFPATQSASTNANTLDDYEEGTWSPAFSDWTTTTGWNFPSGTARYIKIGRMVYISVLISPGSTSLVCPGNTAQLTGMPFPVFQSSGIGCNASIAWSTNYIETLGTGVAYATSAFYAPALNVANSRTVFASGVYETTS
jgi:hypothetical protein